VSDIDAFVCDTFVAFDNACASAPETRSLALGLAGHDIALRYAAPEMSTRFRPALAHLEVARPETPPDLSIGCWELPATGIAPPPPPWSLDDFLVRGRIRGHVDGPVRAAYEEWARVLTLYDRRVGRAVVYVADPATVPRWFDRAPFRTILSWWSADRGLPLLHASAVADDTWAVAIAGASGAGKSTTALTCLAAGLRIVGDDACLVRLDPEPTIFSVYARAKLEPDALERLPSLASLIVDRHDDQTLIDPGPRRAEHARLRALLLPAITHRVDTRVTPLGTTDAVKLLVRSSLQEGVGIVDGALGAMTKLVKAVPCLRLELGTDLDGVVRAIRSVLAGG
jgi:hypothetical protein